MKILRIARKLPPCLGGQEYHVSDLSRFQAANGANVVINYGLGEKIENEQSLITKRVAPAWILKLFSSKDTLQAMIFGIALVFRHVFIRDRKIELVHVHGDILEIWAAAIVAKIYRKKLIVTFHAGLSFRKWYRKAASKILAKPDAIICVSGDIKNQVRQICPDAHNVHVIHSGIHRINFLCEKKLDNSALLELVSVGRLHPMKGYQYLIKALSNKDIRGKVRLTLIGGGPEQVSLKEKALQTGSVINFIGVTSKQNIAKMLCKSDVFVSSSVQLGTQTEGTPTVIMEAMAAGLPVVTTDVGGAKALVKDGENGFLISQEDPDSIAAAIKRFIEKKELIEKMSNANVQASHDFDWNVIGNKVLDVYTGIA